jgi:Carboxypeptidase regulatory-like domain/TonB dependent receptor-like, beta-barrel
MAGASRSSCSKASCQRRRADARQKDDVDPQIFCAEVTTMVRANRSGYVLLLVVVCWFALALPAAAQGVGAIGGIVIDESGAVLPGATVTLANPGVIGGDQSTVSDENGAYQFTHLVPGAYSVKGELQGFRSMIQRDISVNGDRTSRVDLKLAVGDLAETITVAGQAPLLDTRSATHQVVLTREVLDSLPTGSDVWSIARLTPSVHMAKYDVGGREMFGQSGASAHGSNERETFVDGMDLNQYGGTYYVDSFSFEELNMQTANVAAERSTGGVVWYFVTKTGTNRFLGTGMFSGMTHDCCESNNISPAQRVILLAAVPPYALAANPNPRLGSSIEHMFDLGSTLSGPLVKDRLWFATSGKVGEVYTRRVGSYNADGTQLLSDNQLRQESVKISFAANHNNQLHYYQSWVHKGRYHVAGGPNVTEFFSEESTQRNPARHWFHIARWTSVLSDHAVLDVAGSDAYGNNDQLPQPSVKIGDIPRYDTATRIHTVASAVYLPNPGWRANVNTTLSYSAASHDIKIGNEYIRSDVTRGSNSVSDPQGLSAIYRNGLPDSVNTYNTPNLSTGKIITDGVYVQDKWSALHKLTLSLGLRYEYARGWVNDGTSQLCQAETVFIAGKCFPAVKDAPNLQGFVPRMSVVYDIFGDGRTAVKFSANKYRERVTTAYSERINPISTASDTRPWSVCAVGQVSGCDLNGDRIPQLNELGKSTGFNLGTTNRYADGYKLPHTNEADIEFEQQLPGPLVISTGYYYRAYRDQIGSRNLLVPTSGYTPLIVTEVASGRQVTVYNQDPATLGLFDTVFDNEPALDRTFHGVDLTVQKRMSHGWMLMGSATYGRNVGDIYGTADLNNPNNTFRRGVATVDDVPLFFKISGAYTLPYGVQTAGNWSHYTGWPETTTVRVSSNTIRLTQVNQNIVVEPRGTTRMEDVTQVDLNFKRPLTLGRLKFEPRVDIFNLLNANAVLNKIQQLGPTYQNVIEILGSRMVKIGANVSW